MAAVGVVLPAPADFAAWRDRARQLLAAEVPPAQVEWRVAGEAPSLFATAPMPQGDTPARVPRPFLALAEQALRHRDPGRFFRLYRTLWRLTHGEPGLLSLATDPDIVSLEVMAKAVRRDAHKMHAFVRFRLLETPAGPRYLAWFEPEHHIVQAEAGFFVRRFAGMHWSIITPEASAHWDTATLRLGPGGHRRDMPAEDAQEELWRTYYASIFNPARLKPGAMRSEMPMKYWKNLPEARDIPRLIAEAPRRVQDMLERGPTEAATRRQRAVHLPAPPQVAVDMAPPPPQGPEAAPATLRAEAMADRDPLA